MVCSAMVQTVFVSVQAVFLQVQTVFLQVQTTPATAKQKSMVKTPC